MNLRIATSLMLALSAFGALGLGASAKSVLPESQVVVASASGNALVIWDATVFINELEQKKTPSALGMAAIQAMAGKLLVEKAARFRPTAKTVTVKVLYAPTQLAELYKTATFSGFNKLVLVSANRADAVAKGAAWLAILDHNRMPAGMTAAVVGSLPKQ